MLKCCFSIVASGLLALVFFLSKADAQPECDGAYSLCMSGCATDRSAERCMQRCQQAGERCSKSGVFKTPIELPINKGRVEEMSRAKGDIRKGFRSDQDGGRPERAYSNADR